MSKMGMLIRVLGLGCLLHSGWANANLTVYPMALTIGAAAQSGAQFEVLSKSSDVQYVKVTVKHVIAPATKDERDVDAPPVDETGLVVSPQRLVLPAGARRVVRLVRFAPPDVEQVYRVYVETVKAPDDVTPDEPVDGVKSSVGINLVWAVLVYMKPAVASPRLDVDAARTRLLNDGNVRVKVMRAGRCEGEVSDACSWSTIGRNIFPGQTLDLPPGDGARSVVRVDYRTEGGGTRSQVWGHPSP